MPDDLPHQLGETLMLMTRDFQRRLDEDLRKRGVNGVGQRHRSVFLHLGQLGPSRSVDLAEAAGIRAQSMMAVVHELEDLGLIERRQDPSDSRAKLISFTAEGQHFIRELKQSTQTVWKQYAGFIGEEELRRSFGTLQHILAAGKGEL